ncbi:hypothetical protein [Streptomyces endocoffeicus]|uniref:hypothetical protein n=1 Tax=Streptomyces endocoffeicus TaxID=2898945 RepID=UPI001E60BC51|nr:hypothetical protein [Streptomyces endocoffeicus]
MAGEFTRGRGEDAVPLREDAAASGGRGDHAALGHHPGDRGAESERLAAVPPYDLAGTPLRRPLASGSVLLRLLAGGDQDLAGEVDAARRECSRLRGCASRVDTAGAVISS